MLSNFERHDIADHSSLAADYDQLVFLSALYYDVADDESGLAHRLEPSLIV